MLGLLLNHQLAETMASWATTAGIIVALIAGLYTFVKYRADRQFQSEDRARNSYAKFMHLALENPEFFPGCWVDVKNDPVKRTKFEWFIAHFLWASEDIILHDPTDKRGYISGIKDTISEHLDYFSSDAFLLKEASGYCERLREIVAETVRIRGPEWSGLAGQSLPIETPHRNPAASPAP